MTTIPAINFNHRFELGNGYWVEIDIFAVSNCNTVGTAYFTGDFEADIAFNGEFTHPWNGTQYRVRYPGAFCSNASQTWELEQMQYTTICKVG